MRLLALVLLVPISAFGQGLSLTPPGLASRRINYAVHSNDISTGTSIATGWYLSSATVATVAGAPAYAGGGSWAEVTSTVNTGEAGIVIVSSLPPHTFSVVSVWMAKASGSGYAQIYSLAAGVTGCFCYRSDGGACTPAIFSTNYCGAQISDLGTIPVRLAILAVGPSRTSSSIGVYPGNKGVATGTTRLTGAQIEVNVGRASPICVTTTAAKTCK